MIALLLPPGVLADLTGGVRRVEVEPGPLADVLDGLAVQHPRLERRIRDEQGRLRRFVNVFVDGVDVRGVEGERTSVPDGAQVHVLPSVAGGAETGPAAVVPGLQVLTTRSPDGAELDIAPHGAQVLGWRPVSGGERLFLSSLGAPPSIRGGVPVVFPQFSDRGPLPKHGLARDRDWHVVSVAGGRAMLTLTDDADTRRVWPQGFSVVLTAEVLGDRLEIDLTVANTGEQPWSFTAALHCYLAVGQVDGVVVTGLGGLSGEDQAAGRAPVTVPPGDLVVRPPLDLAVLGAHDVRRVVGAATGDLVLTTGGLPDTVVWHPGDERLDDLPAAEQQGFLCVEPAVLTPVRLDPGQTWRGSVRLLAVRGAEQRADDPNGVQPGI